MIEHAERGLEGRRPPHHCHQLGERHEHEEVRGAKPEAADQDGEARAHRQQDGKHEQANVQAELTEERSRDGHLHQELDDLQRAEKEGEELRDLPGPLEHDADLRHETEVDRVEGEVQQHDARGHQQEIADAQQVGDPGRPLRVRMRPVGRGLEAAAETPGDERDGGERAGEAGGCEQHEVGWIADQPNQQRRRKEGDDRRQLLAGPDQAKEPLRLAQVEETSGEPPVAQPEEIEHRAHGHEHPEHDPVGVSEPAQDPERRGQRQQDPEVHHQQHAHRHVPLEPRKEHHRHVADDGGADVGDRQHLNREAREEQRVGRGQKEGGEDPVEERMDDQPRDRRAFTGLDTQNPRHG